MYGGESNSPPKVIYTINGINRLLHFLYRRCGDRIFGYQEDNRLSDKDISGIYYSSCFGCRVFRLYKIIPLMKLIVDSGSTKTDWFIAQSNSNYTVVRSCGINPVVQNCDEIKSTVAETLAQNGQSFALVQEIHFYGAGCTPQKKTMLQKLLSDFFPNADVHVESDLLAAARALCGVNEGLAAILGTGANSCFYDGKEILYNTPALGFILGDEGSGAVLGKKFLNGIMKGWLPYGLRKAFQEEMELDVAGIIDRVYRQPSPNRFLASFSKFILQHLDCPELEALVIRNFEEFISVNIVPYSKLCSGRNRQCPNVINAVGSIAYYYYDQLAKAAYNMGYEVGRIMKSPETGLLDFHFIHGCCRK